MHLSSPQQTAATIDQYSFISFLNVSERLINKVVSIAKITFYQNIYDKQ